MTDTGRGQQPRTVAAGNGSGHGLRGMRERAAAAGGTIEIGPAPAGGFRVAARFPLERTELLSRPPPCRTAEVSL